MNTENFASGDVSQEFGSRDDLEKEDDEAEDIEPKLKYTRMVYDVETILNKDAASCMAVHPKFICVGSRWGNIHILDHQGNNIEGSQLRGHSVAVNQISIDQNGDYIASCSDDGKVFISGLCSTEYNHDVVIGRLVRSVAIDPNYYKSGRRFITGDERLIMHEKSAFLSRWKSTVICEAEGSVQNIKWNGQFVAWASDLGVRVYDVESQRSLGLIKWSRQPNALPEQYRCNICWKNNTILLVGWVDTVRMCVIRKRSPVELANKDLPEFVVEPTSTFSTDFLICGLGPLESNLVILGYSKDTSPDGKAQRPQLYVVEPGAEDYSEICTDSLTLRDFENCHCNDYHLECLTEDKRFFIVSPKDIVMACPCDADDRIQWLLDHKKYELAMETVTKFEGYNLKKYTPYKVGMTYLDNLLLRGKFDEAGKLCVKILGKDKRLWEEQVFKFAHRQQLRAISKYLPQGDQVLDPHIYEMVLFEYLKMDPEGFLQMVKMWPPTIYNVPALVNSVLEHLLVNDKENHYLLEALAVLYSHERKYDKALASYLKLGHKDVFQLIHKHQLYHSIHDKIEGLMNLDAEEAINLFIEKNRVPPEVVVAQLENNQRYLYMYLDTLDRRDLNDVSGKFHGKLMKLHADFNREKLLPFLRQSDQYPIQDALNICQERCFYPEMVYLQDRIGNTKEALTLIMHELRDIDRAIEFCKEHDDIELWENLFEYSLNKPDFITLLLRKIGTYVDPRILVQRIENGLHIPGLKDSLVKMMKDYNLQVSVQEGCKKIIVSDYFNLHEKLVHMQERGILVDYEHACGSCNRKIISCSVNQGSSIMVFYCKHAFHRECLPDLDLTTNCIICKSAKRVLANSIPGRK